MRSSGLGGLSGRWVYGGSWLWALIVAILLSWGMTVLIALVIERRTGILLDPSGQYKAFYFGDSLVLPALVLLFWYLGRRLPDQPNLSQRTWWHIVCFASGLTYGIRWHLHESASHHYTRSMMYAPSKLYHDFVVFPLYIYILFSVAPTAMRRAGWKQWVIFGCLVTAFVALNVYDNYHHPSHGHVNFDWSQFWKRLGMD